MKDLIEIEGSVSSDSFLLNHDVFLLYFYKLSSVPKVVLKVLGELLSLT